MLLAVMGKCRLLLHMSAVRHLVELVVLLLTVLAMLCFRNQRGPSRTIELSTLDAAEEEDDEAEEEEAALATEDVGNRGTVVLWCWLCW